jgi:crotonobetainyl-CoA:carnitine CoA-transferase CaiB-like acyl-CoA transferase
LAPQVGEHNKEILAGLGYGPEEIEKLQAVGAI